MSGAFGTYGGDLFLWQATIAEGIGSVVESPQLNWWNRSADPGRVTSVSGPTSDHTFILSSKVIQGGLEESLEISTAVPVAENGRNPQRPMPQILVSSTFGSSRLSFAHVIGLFGFAGGVVG